MLPYLYSLYWFGFLGVLMKFRSYLAKNVLVSFCGIAFLLLLLIYCWNLVVVLAHADSFQAVGEIMLGVFYKIFARTHQVIPLATLLAVIGVLLNFANTRQLLAVKTLGYNYNKTMMPVLLLLFSATSIISILEQKFAPDFMLSSYAAFCKSGQNKYCKLSSMIWEVKPDYIANIQILPNGKINTKIISLKPSKVDWFEDVKYINGSWYKNNLALPIKIQPEQLRYSILEEKDQPKTLRPDYNLMLAFMLSVIYSLYVWFYLAESK